MAKVLLIEPDTVLARTYWQALQHGGHEVLHAVSAQQAINVADHTSPDIVLLELQLSMHDGIEFLQEFRSYPEWKHVPVIVNTVTPAKALQPVRQVLADSFGVVAILDKHRTTLQQLLQTVRAQQVVR